MLRDKRQKMLVLLLSVMWL